MYDKSVLNTTINSASHDRYVTDQDITQIFVEKLNNFKFLIN